MLHTKGTISMKNQNKMWFITGIIMVKVQMGLRLEGFLTETMLEISLHHFEMNLIALDLKGLKESRLLL